MCPTSVLARVRFGWATLDMFLTKIPYLSMTYERLLCVLLGKNMNKNIATNQGIVGSIPASRTK
jgi:hypothetical protein